MHPALRKDPLFYKDTPHFPLFYNNTPHFPLFFTKKHPPISFHAYGLVDVSKLNCLLLLEHEVDTRH